MKSTSEPPPCQAVIAVTEVDTVSSFRRTSRICIAKLKLGGRPILLTIHGKPALVVQDVAAYQALVVRFVAAEEALRRAGASKGGHRG